ncbi:MAG: aminoglycoside phosphotransferase [Cellulomonas sp. 73-92]|uniref:phosphotransferase family protein n=1 Tax=Cellulomonas sp. 73-92 TaxID=1895740 RepID=UPI000927BF71|nr:aminoglycoside phosphotransferase family protein [Cellulomonas sp. 73-92]OJV79016.1 MAG: aminoglycoside phosphotransferase [Cellulomonas sp. 73-92]
MSADDAVTLPHAFSGQRLDWRDLPRHVRRRIDELAGAQVTAEITATEGFSPGFVAVLELTDGRDVFVKAISRDISPVAVAEARQEIVAAAALPPSVPAPRLQWSDDDGEWVLLGFDAVHGRSPEIPWKRSDLDAVLATVDVLAHAAPLPGRSLPRTADLLADEFTGWCRMRGAAQEVRDEFAATVGPPAAWALSRLPDLARWEQAALDGATGEGIVHGDLRADNVMIDADGKVWLIDWLHASVGPSWFDLAFLLTSVGAQGGGDPATLFAQHAPFVSHDELRAGLAGLTGSLVWGSMQPAPPGVPNLRPFQSAHAEAALRWLRDLCD